MEHFSNLFPDDTKAQRQVVDSTVHGGRVRASAAKVTLNAASNGDVIGVVKIPSHARMVPGSKIVHGALGASVTLSLGVVQGIADTDQLVAATDVSSAGEVDALSALNPGDLSKRLWEIAGYSKDPGKSLDVVSKIEGADTTGSDQDVHYDLHYVLD